MARALPCTTAEGTTRVSVDGASGVWYFRTRLNNTRCFPDSFVIFSPRNHSWAARRFCRGKEREFACRKQVRPALPPPRSSSAGRATASWPPPTSSLMRRATRSSRSSQLRAGFPPRCSRWSCSSKPHSGRRGRASGGATAPSWPGSGLSPARRRRSTASRCRSCPHRWRSRCCSSSRGSASPSRCCSTIASPRLPRCWQRLPSSSRPCLRAACTASTSRSSTCSASSARLRLP